MPSFGVKWETKHLIKKNPLQGGPDHFQNQIENLSDSSVNGMLYAAYYEDMPWMHYVH
jgi:hypothetical protein